MNSLIEQGDPAEDKPGFRRCLGQYATGVTIISTLRGDELAGVTCNSFASLSLDPPLVSWAIRKESASLPAFESCTHFSVSILAVDQIDVSQRFARSGADKFAGIGWSAGLGGVPLIDGSAATLECEREVIHEAGDHFLIIGRVRRFRRFENEVLLFTQGRYGIGAEHPSAATAAEVSNATFAPGEEMMTSLFIRAYAALTPAQSAALQFAGLSLLEGRLLRAIQTSPGSTLEALQPELLFGFGAGELVVGELAGRGLIAVASKGRLNLTPAGEAQFDQVLMRARIFEEQSLSAFSIDDVAATRRVLTGLIKSNAANRT